MKILKTILLTLLPLATINAQIINDSAIMGGGYANDIYYSFGSANQKVSVSNTNYHLAFSNMISQDDKFYTVWINPINTKVTINPSQNANDWAIFSETGSANWRTLENQDTSWGKGGFAVGKEAHPRYAWAKYVANGDFRGDSMYLVQLYNKSTQAFDIKYKMMLVQRVSSNGNRTWTFKIGKTDNSWDTTVMLKDLVNSKGNFMFYNLLDRAELVREPDADKWDAVFTRYNTFTRGIYYTVTGVLTNYGIKTKIIEGNLAESNQEILAKVAMVEDLNSHINGIGYDWKNFDMTANKFVLEENKLRIIYKPTSTPSINEVYALQFSGFEGSSTGKINFKYKSLGLQTVTNIRPTIYQLSVYPNPSGKSINFNSALLLNSFKIYSINGMLISSGLVQNNQIDVSVLQFGTYQLIGLDINGNTYTSKFVKH